MEKRVAKVNISSAGGTAAKGAKTYKITLPSTWMSKMQITQSDRDLQISFDGAQIILSRNEGCGEFEKRKSMQGHDVRCFRYYDGETLCTTICADFTEKMLAVENHINNPVKTAFGNNALPTWGDLEAFLEDRCIPRGRAGLREYLEAIGVSEYNPLEIISKTSGRMAEDNQWIEIVSPGKPLEVHKCQYD